MSNSHEKVRVLNDQFRSTFVGGEIYVTRGIQDLGPIALGMILETVRLFSEFSDDNDPYGEHDFGAFSHDQSKIFWKIDYYDLERKNGSPDPTDAEVTTRVLTVMLADEY